MNLKQLDKLAERIVKKGKEVNEDTLITESLFFPFGTLNYKEANKLLWAKRRQIEQKVKNKYPNKESFLICPSSIVFNYWSNYKRIRNILD